jgi:hypothetical protein
MTEEQFKSLIGILFLIALANIGQCVAIATIPQ